MVPLLWGSSMLPNFLCERIDLILKLLFPLLRRKFLSIKHLNPLAQQLIFLPDPGELHTLLVKRQIDLRLDDGLNFVDGLFGIIKLLSILVSILYEES